MSKPKFLLIDPHLAGLCSSLPVITPNERLAQELKFALSEYYRQRGHTSWPAPRVQSYRQHLLERFQQLCEVETGWLEFSLLGEYAQRLVWQRCAPPAQQSQEELTAALWPLAREGWELLHEWCLLDRLESFSHTHSSRYFRRWVKRYQRLAEQNKWLTPAELPALITRACARGVLPDYDGMLMFGFEIISTAQQALVDAYSAAGKPVTFQEPLNPCASESPAGVLELENEAVELRAAALWARQLVEQQDPIRSDLSIGILVPDLQDRYPLVLQQLQAVFTPMRSEPDPASQLFNVSAGYALASRTACEDALLLLQWLRKPLHYKVVERILRSPFMQFSQSGSSSAIALSPGLNEYLTPAEYLASREEPLLHELWTQHLAYQNPGMGGHSNPAGTLHSPQSHYRHFEQILECAGWGKSDALSSANFQCVERFSDLLGELSQQLVRFSGAAGEFSVDDALAELSAAARQLPFSPRSARAPVQVLGYIEAAGLRFDHLWITGMSDQRWPGNPTPNPFLPISEQLKAGIPRTSAADEFRFATEFTQRLLRSSAETILSYPGHEGDQILGPSPLLADLSSLRPEQVFASPGLLETFHPIRSICTRSGTIETYRDERGSPLSLPLKIEDTATSAEGGCSDTRVAPVAGDIKGASSGILVSQARCPFQAFARYRLGARAPEAPRSLPDARERGSAVHEAMAYAYSGIDSQSTLDHLGPRGREELAQESAQHGVQKILRRFPEPYNRHERQRIAELVLAWFDVDLARPPFQVLGVEHEVEASLADFRFKLRIDRLDQDPEGNRIIIDYKTGVINPQNWNGERPLDMQLPLYASLLEHIDGIAFAALRADEAAMRGVHRGEKLQRGKLLQLHDAGRLGASDWDELLTRWKHLSESFITEFQQGFAAVDPAKPQICRTCDLAALCRIAEAPAL